MSGKRNLDYNPAPLQNLIRSFLKVTGESYRSASEASGLHGTTLSRYMRKDHPIRPLRDACIGLAGHFGVNPNMLLEAAGYERMAIFDYLGKYLGPEALQLGVMLEGVDDPEDRAKIMSAVKVMLEGYRRKAM